MLISSAIRILAGSPHEWLVVTDPVVHYRPDRIPGRRYRVTPSTPLSGHGSGAGRSPDTGR
ncbi:hypothetical protein BJY24_006482 [Nocardia transvalensis]|uniref:Uncharacterized protein n=1 Tax=Nocardia transvalensis TaxID=37333 RepID=A0A7W9PK23_9NOCA|nr:hypothetical protein [Nocardia transvalensis]MBB5917570.1 hypothetical protein [Nocardia transvalensis]